jgi:hypothetical protein
MFALLKYLPLVGLFQDVSFEVRAAGEAQRPWYLQRTFFGALVALVAGFFAIQFGVTIDTDDMTVAADSLTQLAAVIVTAYGAALSLYGLAMKTVKKLRGIAQ